MYAATLSDIRSAAERIEGRAHLTPVMTCAAIDRLAGRRLFFKCEQLQKVGAFKFRGACNAVFTRNLAPGALVVLSGTPVNLEAWKAGMALCGDLPVFQSHGQQDPLLSFQAAEDLNEAMGAAGLATQWVPFRGGHELPMPVLKGLGEFLSDFEPSI